MSALPRLNVPVRVKTVLQAIGGIAEQRGMRAYAVGGCVRDWLLGIATVVDLDVTVEGDGLEMAQAAAAALHGTAQLHRQFGTATVMFQQAARRRRIRIDVATCRRDTYATPAAYPRVVPGTLEDDLFRRDFTINAMAVTVAPARFGRLIDPFGGARDLRANILRVLHDRSFFDDPSRILRGVRFAHRFGFHWERRTQRLLRDAVAAGALGWLNAGRLRKELERMGGEPDPRACLEDVAALLVPGAHR